MYNENEENEEIIECVECGPYSDVELMYKDQYGSFKEYTCRNCGCEWTETNQI